MIKGRFFTDADNANAPLVIIVNQTFAKNFSGDQYEHYNGFDLTAQARDPQQSSQLSSTEI